MNIENDVEIVRLFYLSNSFHSLHTEYDINVSLYLSCWNFSTRCRSVMLVKAFSLENCRHRFIATETSNLVAIINPMFEQRFRFTNNLFYISLLGKSS